MDRVDDKLAENPRKAERVAARPAEAAARYQSLDGLRGLAALSVVLFHTTWPNHVASALFARNAYTAVDLFFLLSGFVIASSHAARLGSPGEIRAFLLRRFFRVYPLHASILAFLVAIECVKFLAQARGDHAPLATHDAFTGARGVGLLLGHVFLVQGTGFVPEIGWNVPSWSVSSEFVAYLLFAAAGFFGLVRSGRLPFAAAGAGLAGYAALALHFHSLDLTAGFGLLRCLAGFAIGVALFRLCSDDRVAPLRRAPSCALSLLEGVALLAVALVLSLAEGAAIFFVVPAYIALLLLFQIERGFFSRLMALGPLQWLGAVSYSVYLIHVPLRNLLVKSAQLLGAPALLVAGERTFLQIPAIAGDALLALFLATTLALAGLTFRFIEQPGRRLGQRLSRNPSIFGGVAAIGRAAKIATLVGSIACAVLTAPAPAKAGCALPGAKLKRVEIERLEKEPKELLDAFPRGGYAMSEAIFQLAARDPRATAQALSVAGKATSAQQKAMGEGLRRYIGLCGARDPEGVKAAQSLIASAPLPNLQRAFHRDDDSLAPAPPFNPRRDALRVENFSSLALDEGPFKPAADPFGRPEDWR